MLSKNQIKLIRSLELKKNRRSSGLFVAEGFKTVCELLPHFECRLLVGTGEGLRRIPRDAKAEQVVEVTDEELTRASLLRCPQELLALFVQPSHRGVPVDEVALGSLCLALDGVQDPGNMGTIVRIADWYGIRDIFCSADSADVFNPKTVQATMGAIARVRVHYVELPLFLQRQRAAGVPLYGTFLHGDNIYRTPLSPNGIVVMGSEGNGIGGAVEPLVTQRLFIPPYPGDEPTSESLNVAVATGVVCSEFRRRAMLDGQS